VINALVFVAGSPTIDHRQFIDDTARLTSCSVINSSYYNICLRMVKPNYRGKVKRGGGKKFSRDLQPITAEEAEQSRNRWRQEKGEGDEEDEEDDEEEDSDEDSEEEDDDDISKMTPTLRIGPPSDDEEEAAAVAAASKKNDKSKASVEESGAGNLNRQGNKQMSISSLGKTPATELSRREREALEKKQAQERYWKLHEQGKTEQARNDLARLALIRQEREAKAKQRVAETEQKKQEATAKAAAQGRRK